MELEPDLGALSTSYAEVLNIPLSGLAFPGAISYRQAHPSSDEEVFVAPSNQDRHLRRFLCLGWVIQVNGDGNDNWIRTGHVLVLDMDDTIEKKRHPWFVLAAEWYDDHGWYPDDQVIRSEEFVEQGRTDDEEGILPGSTSRTTVARLESKQLETQNKQGPFLQYFHKNLEFELEGFGLPDKNERHDPRYLRGTYRPVFMEMYWDATRHEEVCYNVDKMVYFRYHRPTGRYTWVQHAATDNFTEELKVFPSASVPKALRPTGRSTYAQQRWMRDAQRTTEV